MTATYAPGQDTHWHGLAHKFDKPVTIVREYLSYLMIMGETEADGKQVYDIFDPTVGLIFAIPEAQLHSAVKDTRACPDCGRPQHYTGTEHGWAHDALVDTWHCADPKAAHNQGTREAGA